MLNLLCSVREHSDQNLMTARNLGVVFGRKFFHNGYKQSLTSAPQQRSCGQETQVQSSVTWPAKH